MDGANHTRNDESQNTLNNNHVSNNRSFDAQSVVDGSLTMPLNLQEKDAQTHQTRDGMMNSSLVVFPLSGLNPSNSINYNNTTSSLDSPSCIQYASVLAETTTTPQTFNNTQFDSSMFRIEHQLTKDENIPSGSIINDQFNSNPYTHLQHARNNSNLSSNDNTTNVTTSHVSNNISTQSANTIHFNTNHSMSKMKFDTDLLTGDPGTFSPQILANNISMWNNLSNNNNSLQANTLLINDPLTQKNMQNGQQTPQSFPIQHYQQQQHVVSNSGTNLNTNVPISNIPSTIMRHVQQPQSQLGMYPINNINHMHQLANSSLTPQMVNNQQTNNIQSNWPNTSFNINANMNALQPTMHVNNQTSQMNNVSNRMQEETMLKLDLDDFLKSVHSEEYRQFIDSNYIVVSNNSINSNTIVNNNQPAVATTPSASFSTPLSVTTTNYPLQQANPSPNFVPSSNLLNNPTLSNIVNNNILQIITPKSSTPLSSRVSLNHLGSTQQPHVNTPPPPPPTPTPSLLQVSNTSSHQTPIIKFISSLPPTPPTLLQQSNINHPIKVGSTTPTSNNFGGNSTYSTSMEAPKEYVIHENEYDKKKVPKSKKRQSVDYCNQKKMEFKMEISKPQVVTSSMSVTTTSTPPHSISGFSNTDPTNVMEDTEEENK